MKVHGEKPLEKMTVKELREEALKITDLQGVHAMNKEELLIALRKAKGLPEKPTKKAGQTLKALKQKIKKLKSKKLEAIEAGDKELAASLRKQISKLKKKTRRAA